MDQTLKTRLEGLECHFTWKLDYSRSKLERLRESMIDHEGGECNWSAHLYNLLAYLHYALGSRADAFSCLRKAYEAVHQSSPEDMGAMLIVHYGILAWVRYDLGQLAESQRYVEKAEGLMRDNPSPSPTPGDLHPEVCGEKAWTLKKFNLEKNWEGLDCFRMAMRGDPENVVLQRGYAITLYTCYKGNDFVLDQVPPEQKREILEQLKRAREVDPQNMTVTTFYLRSLADEDKDKACQLAEEITERPIEDINGFRVFLWFLRDYVSLDKAIEVATKAQASQPHLRQLKKRLAQSYKWKVYSLQKERPTAMTESLSNRAVNLYEELTTLYPKSQLYKIDLAALYSIAGQIERADQIFQDLLEMTEKEQDPHELQELYNRYANHLFFVKKENSLAIDFNKKAAGIMVQSRVRDKSIHTLKQIVSRGRNRRCHEIEDFLDRLDLEGTVTQP